MINIICNIDNVYTQHCGVMLTSLFENNKEEKFHVYILCGELEADNKEKLLHLANLYNNQLSFCPVDYSLLKDCPIRKHDVLTLATYLRLFISQVLPSSVLKAIYLDCDMIVNSSIRELWDINVSHVAMGGVEDWSVIEKGACQRLGYPQTYSYVNAGLLLINVDYWRKHDITQLALQYISTNPDKVLHHDQDTLNALLYDKKIMLPIKWNMMNFFFHKGIKLPGEYDEVLEKYIKNPCIIHFTASVKPWHREDKHPYKYLYYKYLALTGWKGYVPPFHYMYYIKKIVRPFFIWLGLKSALPSYRRI